MRIFVSHSTDPNAGPAKTRLFALEKQLRKGVQGQKKPEVLLDKKRLNPGFKWREELDHWLEECNAGVLLLTPRALASEWVLKEATILAHRASIEPRFRLFPVLLDGVTRANLSKSGSGFSPLYLAEIQRVTKTTPQGIARDVLTELGDQLRAAPASPQDELVAALVRLLDRVAIPALEELCADATGSMPQWAPSDVRSERCARALASAVVKGNLGRYANVVELTSGLLRAGISKENAGRILRLIAPTWVDLDAAALLSELAKRNNAEVSDIPSGASVINGQYVQTFTAEMYMRRAYLPKTAKLVSIAGGESDLRFEELAGKIRDEIRRSEKLQNRPDAFIDQHAEGFKRPYLVVLPPPVPDESLLTRLREIFPRLTFIATTDEFTDSSPAPSDQLVRLLPALNLADERAQHDFYRDAEQLITDA